MATFSHPDRSTIRLYTKKSSGSLRPAKGIAQAEAGLRRRGVPKQTGVERTTQLAQEQHEKRDQTRAKRAAAVERRRELKKPYYTIVQEHHPFTDAFNHLDFESLRNVIETIGSVLGRIGTCNGSWAPSNASFNLGRPIISKNPSR